MTCHGISWRILISKIAFGRVLCSHSRTVLQSILRLLTTSLSEESVSWIKQVLLKFQIYSSPSVYRETMIYLWKHLVSTLEDIFNFGSVKGRKVTRLQCLFTHLVNDDELDPVLEHLGHMGVSCNRRNIV